MVAKYASHSEAAERAAFLQAHGIATHVSDMTSMRPNLAHQGQYRAGLWVVLEAQYEDALGLLENPDHDIQNPLSLDQMQHIETRGALEARNSLLKWLLVSAVGLGLVALLVVRLGNV
ncbi:MAG: hypothetical protein EA370_10105 [Wenzhouxiangella sp.]|nr:MAG: hypothetical protein EA370_10105 [Wenzhouxiangella sp.]